MIYKELLTAIDIEQYTCVTRELLTTIAIDMIEFINKHPDEAVDVIDGLINLGTLQDNFKNSSSEEVFELIGSGCYKECYYFSPSLIIKFCALHNPTSKEKEILLIAQENNFNDIFIAGKYYNLPHSLTSNHLNWNNSIFTHVCIQPRVITVLSKYEDYDDLINIKCSTHYSEWPLIRETLGLSESAQSCDYRGINMVCECWVLDFIKIYGAERLKQFAQFCAKYNIFDLHNENIGYTLPDKNGLSYPIVLDWMSY